MRAEIDSVLARTRGYLVDELLPFWIERSPDPDHGGFLTHFDRDGRPTGDTTKTFLMQARMLYTMASAHRQGYGGGRCAELAREGARFLIEHYWDDVHGGWIWLADRDGCPLNQRKIGYGQCFAMYALGEYYLATGDPDGRAALEETYRVAMERMTDRTNGGFLEIFECDWRPAPPGSGGGDRKSFDVHMHMMEALTKVLEVTSSQECAQRLRSVIEVLTDRMLDAETGTGIQQFAPDFTPLPAIEIDVAWGRDERPSGKATPVEVTSYGHNVEFAWLLLEAADALGVPRDRYASVVRRICDDCIAFGIDPELGGVYIEGRRDAPRLGFHKQFWQQAEVMLGMLDAWQLLDDARYWHAFRNVHDFVFEHFVHHEGGGEWFALVDRDGTPLWDYLGDAWKISYHTVRSMIGVVRRLGRGGPRGPCP